MLLREADGDAVLAIGQASHAWLSGQLACSWGNERFGTLTPRDAVCLAATQHDVGMADWDLRPALNPATGRPFAFTEMRRADHVELWSGAPARLLSQSTYAALLVSLHGTGLYERHVDVDRLPAGEARLVRDYLAAQRRLQDELTAATGAQPAELERNRSLLAAWDALSLALCLRWAPYTCRAVPSAGEPLDVSLTGDETAGFALDPWPFAAPALTVRCEGRLLGGRFADEDALHAALADAAPVMLAFELRRA